MLHYSEHDAHVVPVVGIKACLEKELDIAPHVLRFVTGRRSVFSLTLGPLYLREKSLLSLEYEDLWASERKRKF